VACLALATGFAGLAARAASEVSALSKLLWNWQSLVHRPRQPSHPRSTAGISPEPINQRLEKAPRAPPRHEPKG
jgi:hypothetical protein